MLTASFELDDITDEEKTEIEQESKPQCSSSERETNDGLDSPIDVKDSSRFGGQTSDVDFTAIQREFESKNTRKNTTWALRIWHSWRDQNMKATNEVIPDLETMDATTLNFFLSRFVLESRKKDGNPYPPKSLYYIMCGLLRHMREIGITDMNFLSNDRFLGFQKTLDARMKQLHSSGIGVSRKQARAHHAEQGRTSLAKRSVR